MENAFDFDYVQQYVADRHPGLELIHVPGLDRCLKTTAAFDSGSVILEEEPLACGHFGGSTARQVLDEPLASLHEENSDAQNCNLEDVMSMDEDAIHPNSTLCDCICEVIRLHKTGDEVKLRQLATLCRTAVPENPNCGHELHDNLRPEFQECCSPELLVRTITAVLSNRFGTADGLILMFAGSFFEHSCSPNVFSGDIDSDHLKKLRALRKIAPGERLSIDYLMLPHTYLPTKQRREMLESWGFRCQCSRCEDPVEKVRCFVCPECGEDDIYWGSWTSRCGYVADDECRKECELSEDQVTEWWMPPKTLSSFHYRVFQSAWTDYAHDRENAPEELLKYLLQSVDWFMGPHPQSIDFAHALAELDQVLDSQGHWLEIERSLLGRFFPEELRRCDKEIWKLLGCNPGTQAAPVALDEMD